MPKKKSKPLSAAGRAYKSTPKSYKKAMKSALGITGKATRAQRKAIGSVARKSRIKRGLNPNTGGKVTAKQMGLKGTAKKAYKAAPKATKRAVVKGMGKSGLGKTGAKYNKLVNTPATKRVAAKSSGPTKKTRTVGRIAKRRGISRAAANRVRKSRKK